MDRLLQNVDELPATARSVVETLMGHPLRDDQQLYIVALDKTVEPAIAERRQAWRELQQIIAEMRENARRSGLPSDEIERRIDEACEKVRYGTKPCE